MLAGSQCAACGAELSRFATEPVCPTCHASTPHRPQAGSAPTLAPALWMWSSSEASSALRSRDLATILRAYRRLNRLSQEQLAAVLGYDKTYVSMIETRRRTISDVGTRRHIAHTLGLPTHVLGVTDSDDADFAAMLQFGDSTIRLAEIARQSGRAVDAVNELWPLVARLEARAAEGHTERDTLVLLGHGRAALGVSLGTVLPEERLTAAARWTGKALLVAERLGDPAFLAHVLRMHGNELRKAEHHRAAVARLDRAIAVSPDRAGQGAAYALLARAAGEQGNPIQFDEAIGHYRDLLDSRHGRGMLFNPFTFREIHLRGLVATGRAADAARIMATDLADASPVAPQWHIIERVTAGQVLIAAGDRDAAEDALNAALVTAESHRLPHQIQRTIRAASGSGLIGVAEAGQSALIRLNERLSPAVES
ncbi:helix-turn-helix transcriptional regulator [Amycolatopsis cihanbeyliensis]|uniref:Transcriptional regulator with XRE-family HTH domain n=1 Tax=Amycolatopsis cihanbeyliensis TaxID=1128664 RepID=A0A542DMF0_AMYCI|nr:helix-turn-helix domain-containing protein [Amycolatopsis cihanbeyliensis]TQJ04273.1 transcriptional regulator with XRE-family HTH domain [Amycolatopsis cihanbeyliensis]